MVLFILGMAVGFLAINGYWMILLWMNFKNPFFPFFNGIFKSPFFYNVSISNYLGPIKLIEKVFYPFYFSWNRKIGIKPVHDIRMAIVYLLLVFLTVKKIFKRTASNLDDTLTNSKKYFITFFIVSYIFWQYQFSIERYMMVLDLLAPLLIYLLLKEIFKTMALSESVFLSFLG